MGWAQAHCGLRRLRAITRWITPHHLQHKSVYPVVELRFRQEHVWAISIDYVHTVFMTELNRSWADGALAASTVHPDIAHARIGTVVHHLISLLRRGHQQGGLDRRLNGLHAWKAFV